MQAVPAVLVVVALSAALAAGPGGDRGLSNEKFNGVGDAVKLQLLMNLDSIIRHVWILLPNQLEPHINGCMLTLTF